MSRVKCIYFEVTKKVQLYFRRYVSSSKEDNQCPNHYMHQAMVKCGIEEVGIDDTISMSNSVYDKTDERSPKKCEHCDYEFSDNDEYQIFKDRIYRNTETGEELPSREMHKILGAMYYVDWLNDIYPGPDGRCLSVILPNGNPWTIDSRASNCTLPDDKVHKCWVRHGEVPNISVGKDGITCSAGAGSIQSGNYHGFLRNGYLEEC